MTTTAAGLRVAADPGPLPAHDIAIWVRGDDSETINVAAALADGWLGHLGPDGIENLRARLRQLSATATAVGREPRELQRVIVADLASAASLAPLIIEHGISTVVLRLDQTVPTDQLAQFLATVGPTLQDAGRVAWESGTIPRRPLRRTEVREQRRGGIDYDGVPDALAASAVEPGDLAHAGLRSTYLRGGNPGLVLRPRSAAEVSDAVGFARRHPHLPLGIRSGGHGLSGRSTNDGGLVIDVGGLNTIEVIDEARRLVRVGPGSRWRDVATALQPYGWALTSGDYGGVGVGGLATTGGIGFLGRKHGLTIDHLRGVELVLADGSVVRASTTENTELFWAVRGAGANFGIVTSFDFIVDEVPDVGWAQLAFRFTDPAAFLTEFGRVADAAPRETTPFLVMNGSGTAHIMAMVASDDPEVVIAQLQPFAGIAPMVGQQVVIAPYAAVMNIFPESPHNGQGEPVSRSGLVRTITPEVAAASARLLTSGSAHWFQIRTMGGAISDVAPEATAFAHREAHFQITAMGANADRVDRFWDAMRPHFAGTYLSFETDTSPERITEAFPPAALGRLRRLKSDLDPTNLFRDNFNITAETMTSGSAS